MNGKQIGALHNQWQSSKVPLTDAELTELIDGLQVIFDFFSESRISPLTVYYGMQLESLKRCRDARTAQ